jgi:hypothetical protein
MFSSALEVYHGEGNKRKVVCKYAGVVLVAFAFRGILVVTVGKAASVQRLSILIVELGFLAQPCLIHGLYSCLHNISEHYRYQWVSLFDTRC